jgi:lipid-binding SYLF domain-containing protein
MIKKYFPALLAASLLAFCAVPLVRATPDHAELVTEVESCEAIIREFQANPLIAIPPSILKQARGVLITNQFKAGFIFGVKGGYGVVMVKKPNGAWSLPVLVRAHDVSLGFQAGARTVETIYVFMNDATSRLLYNQRFHVGVDAKAVAGPHIAEVESTRRPLLGVPVLVYDKTKGLYAGATVNAAQVARDDDANFALYSTKYVMPELLYSDWVTPPPEVQPLMQFMKQIAP